MVPLNRALPLTLLLKAKVDEGHCRCDGEGNLAASLAVACWPAIPQDNQADVHRGRSSAAGRRP